MDTRIGNVGKEYRIVKKYAGSKPVGTTVIQKETDPIAYADYPEFYEEVFNK